MYVHIMCLYSVHACAHSGKHFTCHICHSMEVCMEVRNNFMISFSFKLVLVVTESSNWLPSSSILMQLWNYNSLIFLGLFCFVVLVIRHKSVACQTQALLQPCSLILYFLVPCLIHLSFKTLMSNNIQLFWSREMC